MGQSPHTLTPDMKVLVLLGLLSTCLSLPRPQESYASQAQDEPPLYTYQYKVEDDYTGTNFGADESRDGVQASGTYFVKLPDSRIQRVAYSVNADGGYIAEVSYEGEAVFPEVKPYVPSPAPSYSSSR